MSKTLLGVAGLGAFAIVGVAWSVATPSAERRADPTPARSTESASKFSERTSGEDRVAARRRFNRHAFREDAEALPTVDTSVQQALAVEASGEESLPRDFEALLADEERQVEFRYGELRDLLRNEAVDFVWSEQIQAAVREQLAGYEVDIEELDCRATICSIRIAILESGAGEGLMTTFYGPGISGGTFHRRDDGRIEGFLAREGTRLPSYEELVADEEVPG